MKDLFSGFGAMSETAQEEKNKTQNVSESSSGSSENERSDAADKEEYLKYVEDVASIEEKERILDEARKAESKMWKAVSDASEESERIKSRYDKEIDQLESNIHSLRNTISNSDSVIKKLRSGADISDMDFNRPQVDENAFNFFTNSFAGNLTTGNQNSLADMPLEDNFGAGKKVENIKDFSKRISEFEKSSEFDQLVNCIPTDEFIQHITNRVVFIAAVIFFLFVMLGGFGLKVVSTILTLFSWVLIYPVVSFICYNISFAIFNAIMSSQKDHRKFSAAASGLFSFGIVGPLVSGAVVSWVMGIISNGSIVSRIVIGLVVAGVAAIGSYFIFSRKFVLNAIRKIPLTKKLMLKKLFRDNDNDEFDLNIICITKNEEISDYFEDNFVRDTIAMHENTIKNSEKSIAEKNAQIESAKSNCNSELARQRKVISDFNAKAEEAKKYYNQCFRDIVFTVQRINNWNQSSSSPDIDWLSDNWFGDYICFTDAVGKRDLRVLKHSLGKIKVLYSTEGKDKIDAMAEAIQRTLSAFTHMIPNELADYSVVDFNMGEAGKLFSYDIDWKTTEASSSGGVSKKATGIVAQVGNSIEGDEFKRYLVDYYNSKKSFVNSAREKILSEAKAHGASKVEMRYINAVRGTVNGNMPFKYQIVLFIPGRRGTTGSSFYDIKGLYGILESLDDSFIPVFLIEKDTEISDKDWKDIVYPEEEDRELSALRTVELKEGA